MKSAYGLIAVKQVHWVGVEVGVFVGVGVGVFVFVGVGVGVFVFVGVGVGVFVFVGVGVGVGVGQVGQSPNKVQDTPIGTDGNVNEQTYVIPWPTLIGELGEPQHGVNCIISKTDVTVIL